MLSEHLTPDLQSARSVPACIDTPSQAADSKTSAAKALPRQKPRPDAPSLPMAFSQLPVLPPAPSPSIQGHRPPASDKAANPSPRSRRLKQRAP